MLPHHELPRCLMRRRLSKHAPRCGSRRRGAGSIASDTGLPVSTTAWLGDDRLFTPLGHEPGYDYPLLVWLPESSRATAQAPGKVKSFDLGRVMKRVSLRNFVAIQPVITSDEAPAIGLEEAVWRSIERVRERIAIHPDRIFLVGQGAGGSAAFRVACRQPRDFAGVISLGGLFPLDEGLFAHLAEVRRLPMLFCCQRSSVLEHAAHTDRTLRLFHAAGAALAMRIYPGSNDLSKSVLADVNRWVMDEVCGPPAAVHTLSAS
jgi:phospholipase/carboxylesterase